MAGGYTDDRYVQGGKNADAYSIWHWYLIDVFVYFSHDLVTLPPPCWTNTAHRHGVKVLGTFIMEWDEGRKRADKLLSTKDSAQMYAERLTELAVALGFDGWLINMEVNLDPGQIPNLKAFVSYLSETMHSSLPGSLVIWYDSVTVDGELSWQNQLNDKNKPFFDLCDGIFVNYSWEEDFPKLSADAAGDRKFDVYMGIDVFGRGTYGGGQWTSNIALDVIKKMTFQLPYLHLDGSMRLSNHLTFKLLRVDGGDLLKNHGELYRIIPKYFHSTQILIRVMVTTYIVKETKFWMLLGTIFLPKAFSLSLNILETLPLSQSKFLSRKTSG
ncbi:UNVERIFIED_CONTAM: Cytosolic endo-beta-N-acetylglucosaminidase 1 [Sesamum latifolium]|uniref:mannosyl-glycoprotein endo-beta-N-acetylglucosaminidase n=1 Tax=Sesamum latifolium TaxID=2727402 RepID=A0AAW2TA52_9LAMI